MGLFIVLTWLSTVTSAVQGAVHVSDDRQPGGPAINLADLPVAVAVEHPVESSTVQDLNASQFAGHSFVLPNITDVLEVVSVNKTGVINDRWGPVDSSNPNVQLVITDLHNFYRRRHPAANMLKMQWNLEAADLAQDWANKCQWNYSEPAQRKTTEYSCNQNIARANYQMSWNATLQLWYGQGVNFRFDEEPANNGIVGDFTQMAWAKSWQVGCGYKFCAASMDSFHLYVCNYCPAGNVIPNQHRPYEPSPARGRVCDRCGGPQSPQCDAGLCTNACRAANKFTNCDVADGHFPGLFPGGCEVDTNELFKEGCKATCECKEKGLLY